MNEQTGYTALDLIGYTDKGDYSPVATYVKNDLVNYGGTKWRCLIDDTTAITPTEGLNWTVFVAIPADTTKQIIAPVEGATSLHAYAVGDQLIYNDTLYKVISAIAVNDALVVGTNIQASDTVIEQVDDNKSDIQTLHAGWQKNGAYNLCSNEKLTTQVLNGITITFNPTGYPKGCVKLDTGSGTATTGTWISVNYKTMGLVTGQTYRTQVNIYVSSGASLSNVIVKPMITTDLNATYDDYVPYAKTNSELTEDSYGVVTLDGTKEKLAESPASFVSVPSGTETVVVNYTATSNMTGCFIVTGTIVDGNATGYRRIRMRLARTGQQFYFNVYTAPGMVMSSNYQSTNIALPMRLKAGDNVTILATQDSGNSLRFAGTIEFIGKK